MKKRYHLPRNRENIYKYFYVILLWHIVDVNYRKYDLICLIAKQVNQRDGGGEGQNLKSRRKSLKLEALFPNYLLVYLSRKNVIIIFSVTSK